MSGNKKRVYISDHGTFRLFDMDISLPAIVELTQDQIEFINASGLYKISELNSAQSLPATPTILSAIEGDRFESARTISVNELSFKAPIMGTQFAKKAQNAIIVKKNSIYAKAAIKNQNRNNETTTSEISEQPTTTPTVINTVTVQEIKDNSNKESNDNKKKKNNTTENNESRSDV